MVFFTCNSCGSSLKKANVQIHVYKCHSRVQEGLSCQDCCQNFTLGNYNAHVSCVTEAQRYGDALQRSQMPKSQMQQKILLESLVSMRTKTELSPDVKKVLNHLSTMNIPGLPTKEKKLKNLLTNVIRIPDNTFAQLMVLVKEILGSLASENSSLPVSLQQGVSHIDKPVKIEECQRSRKKNETIPEKISPSTDKSTPKSQKRKLSEKERNLSVADAKTDVFQKKTKKNKLEKMDAEELKASLLEGKQVTPKSRMKNIQEEQVQMSPSTEESSLKFAQLTDEDGQKIISFDEQEHTAKSRKKHCVKNLLDEENTPNLESRINTEYKPFSSHKENNKILQISIANTQNKKCKVSINSKLCPENTQADRLRKNEDHTTISEDKTQMFLVNGESIEQKIICSSEMPEEKFKEKMRKSKHFGNESSFTSEMMVNGSILAEYSKFSNLEDRDPLMRNKIYFKWKSSIRNALRTRDCCRMKLRKLEKQLLAAYLSAGGEVECGKALFMKTLKKKIFLVDDKYVQLKKED